MLMVFITHLLCLHIYFPYLHSLYINLCCVSIGWTVELKENILLVYKLEVFKAGPEVALSLTIREDFLEPVLLEAVC